MRSDAAGEHSLADAVADGTLSKQAAFCGLTPGDVASLTAQHPAAEVLVRLRSCDAEGRAVLRAMDFASWSLSDETLLADGRRWKTSDVRDVRAYTVVVK